MRGHFAEILPSVCPCSAGLLAGFAGDKIEVRAIPLGWGSVVTKCVAGFVLKVKSQA